MIGQTISHYTVLEKLGAGGMGEIYKAQDTRLNRFVAIKVLSGGSSGDPERRRRFIQEAQAASALNHPNIITIYDVLSVDGMDLMVMEYIAGSTLDMLIPKEGMTVGKVLECAVQMASALEAAHAAGIVHRDLKPGNVMVTQSGLVKILDFGLAKLTAPLAAVDEADATLPLSAPMTVEGSILGTVSYMSPEQADARPVDARSDIFTFGVVMYEMLTGHKAFAMGSTVSTLSAILRDEPKAMDQFVHGVPDELDQIVHKAMRKDPAQRWQSMQEIRIELAALKQRADSAVLSRPAMQRPPKKGPNVMVLAGGIAALACVLAGGAWWLTHRSAPPAPPVTPVTQVIQPPSEPVPDPNAATTASTDTAATAAAEAAAALPTDAQLNNQGVLDMLDAKVPNSVIISHVRSSKSNKFDLSTGEIIKLTKAGANAELIETMRNPKAAPSSAAAKQPKATSTAPVITAASAPPTVATPAPANPVPAAPPTAPEVPAAAPAAASKGKTITIYADLPLGITLTEDVLPNPTAGQQLHFVVARDFRVDDVVIVAKGTKVTGEIIGNAGRKLLVIKGRPTFKLTDVEAFDGTKLKIRATAGGRGPKEDRFIEAPGKHEKNVLAPAGTHYQVYFDGNQTVVINPH
jgi:serine/threonine protein kinase